MASHCFIITSLIFSLPSINSQFSPFNERMSLMEKGTGESFQVWEIQSEVEEMAPLMHATSLQDPDSGVATDLRSWKGRSGLHHHHHHLRSVHGVLNIIGWGTLLPIGVIIARYFREYPMKCNEWYSLHILCQASGFIFGTIGWAIGLWVGNASKQHTFRTNQILGTIIFTLTMIQMLALCLQPKEESRKYWQIYHHFLGYALVALIVANIFQGVVKNQSSPEKWRWFYVGELGVLAIIALILEIFRCIKSTSHQPVVLNGDIYASS